jgi:hypothetical protein
MRALAREPRKARVIRKNIRRANHTTSDSSHPLLRSFSNCSVINDSDAGDTRQRVFTSKIFFHPTYGLI